MRTRIVALIATCLMAAGCAATYPNRISEISGNDALNQLTADSAPQQSVVNGWTTRDYLELAAWQATEQSVLLYVLIAALLIVLIVLIRQSRSLERLNRQVMLLGTQPTTGPMTAESPHASASVASRDT
jgi:hypothetical protein